jgi:hypothetical protein
MALLPLTTQDTQMLLMLKPYLTLTSQAWLDGLLTLALFTNRELRQELSPLPMLQLLGLMNTRSHLQAERARARALGLAKEEQYMPQPLDTRDISLILAIKPFLSDKSQILVDTLVNLLSVISGSAEKNIDPEAIANLINLIAQANTAPSEAAFSSDPTSSAPPPSPWTPAADPSSTQNPFVFTNTP